MKAKQFLISIIMFSLISIINIVTAAGTCDDPDIDSDCDSLCGDSDITIIIACDAKKANKTEEQNPSFVFLWKDETGNKLSNPLSLFSQSPSKKTIFLFNDGSQSWKLTYKQGDIETKNVSIQQDTNMFSLDSTSSTCLTNTELKSKTQCSLEIAFSLPNDFSNQQNTQFSAKLVITESIMGVTSVREDDILTIVANVQPTDDPANNQGNSSDTTPDTSTDPSGNQGNSSDITPDTPTDSPNISIPTGFSKKSVLGFDQNGKEVTLNAQFYGSININGKSDDASVLSNGDSVKIEGLIVPDSKHKNQSAEIIVVGLYTESNESNNLQTDCDPANGHFYMNTAGFTNKYCTWISNTRPDDECNDRNLRDKPTDVNDFWELWDSNMGKLQPMYTGVTLDETGITQELYADTIGSYQGQVCLYFGYRLNGTLVFNSDPIVFNAQ